jgi:hypothetical protein
MVALNNESRCKALTKKGKPCRAAATAGGLCFFHASPNMASELGRIGGRKRRVTVPENAEPLPTLDSMIAVRDAVDRLIADVYAGKLHPRIASGLAPLLQLQLRTLAETEMEGRLSRLERLVTRREQKSKSNDGRWGNAGTSGTGLFSGPATASESQDQTASPPTAPSQQAIATDTKKGCSSVDPRVPEPGSEQFVTQVQAQMPSDGRVGPRIQDAAARALQAQVEEQMQGGSRVVVRVQDAGARALPQHKSELPITDVVARVASNPAVQEATAKTTDACEKECEQPLANLAERAKGESGDDPTNNAALPDPERLAQLLRKAEQEFPPEKRGWLGIK